MKKPQCWESEICILMIHPGRSSQHVQHTCWRTWCGFERSSMSSDRGVASLVPLISPKAICAFLGAETFWDIWYNGPLSLDSSTRHHNHGYQEEQGQQVCLQWWYFITISENTVWASQVQHYTGEKNCFNGNAICVPFSAICYVTSFWQRLWRWTDASNPLLGGSLFTMCFMLNVTALKNIE